MHELITRPPQIAGLKTQSMVKTFWVGVGILILLASFTASSSSFESILVALLIAIPALIPSYLWCSGRVTGIPIFPVFALSHLWAFALPMMSRHPEVIVYSMDSQLIAGLTVAGFLGIGIFSWLRVAKAPSAPVKSYRALEDNSADWFFLATLGASALLTMGMVGGWFTFEWSMVSLLRGILYGISSLATFVLTYRWGQKELPIYKRVLFLVLLISGMVANGASLLLVNSLSITALAAAGFVLGRRKIPWIPLGFALLGLIILHSGKGDMRSKYWSNDSPDSNQQNYVQPWEYPTWFAEWTGYALDSLSGRETASSTQKNSFAERMSLIHLLLLAQDKTPNEVSYLYGETYTIIPELLVPRFLNPNKLISHEGTTILNVHYGKQTREDTQRTTIGWGLLNESYANFGYIGCGMLAIILGTFYGYATRYSIGTSILSARSLFSILVVSFAYQTEFSAGVYVAALFQSAVPLLVLTVIFMKVHQVKGSKQEKTVAMTR
jgi:hypothetical protein